MLTWINPRVIWGIKGLGIITIKYLAMLAGNANLVKADRHIRRFPEKILSRRTSAVEAEDILRDVAIELRILPKQLDNSIWHYQRELKAKKPRPT